MNTQLNQLISATTKLDAVAFDKELDFLGTYSGLTAHNFYTYIAELFQEIKSLFIEFKALEPVLIEHKDLRSDEYCYGFLDQEDEPIICFVFFVRDRKVKDIRDGSGYIADMVPDCFCRELIIYEDDRVHFVFTDEHIEMKYEIEKATEEFSRLNRLGLGFADCHTWFHRFKHLGNHLSYNNTFYYRYKKNITFLLHQIRVLLKEEIRNKHTESIEVMLNYFDMNNKREVELYKKVKIHDFYAYDDYVEFYIGYGEFCAIEINYN